MAQQPPFPAPPAPAPVPAEPAPARRSRGMLFVALGVVVALVAGATVFLLTRGDGGQALHLGFAKGQTFRYRLTAHDIGSREEPSTKYDVLTTATFTLTIERVDADGVAMARATVQRLTVAPAGQESSVLDPPQDQTVRITPDGRLLDPLFLLADPEGHFFSVADQFTPLLSTGNANIGDSWTVGARQAMSIGDGGTTFDGTSRLSGFELVDGRRAAVVDGDFTETFAFQVDAVRLSELGGGTASQRPDAGSTLTWDGSENARLTSWLDADRGVVLRSSLRARYELTTSASGPDATTTHSTGAFNQEVELLAS
jgi:hypothetical protein